MLTVHGYEIPLHALDNDFYRQALELDLRGKREYTEAILNAMGGIDKARFSRYKSLQNLSDEAIELANSHNIKGASAFITIALRVFMYPIADQRLSDVHTNARWRTCVDKEDGCMN